MDQGEFMQGLREEFSKFVSELRDTLNQTASGSPPIGSTSPTATREGNILQTLGFGGSNGDDLRSLTVLVSIEQETQSINAKLDALLELLAGQQQGGG